MSILRRLVPVREQRIVRDPAWVEWAKGNSPLFGGSAGQAVTPETSMRLLVVWGCVSLISDTIATMPVDVYRRQADGTLQQVPNPTWVETPNGTQDRVQFVQSMLVSLLLTGEAIVLVDRFGRDGYALSLILADPTKAEFETVDGRRVLILNGAPYDGEYRVVRAMTWPGSERGLSPIEHARKTIGLGMATLDSGSRFFGQGSIVPGVITTPSSLTREQLTDLKNGWVSAHSGLDNAHLPAVLMGGASWQSLSITHEQAQFLETRKFTDAQISGQLFRVDPSMLGIAVEGGSSLTYQNIEQRNTNLVQMTLLPWIVRLERMFSALLPGELTFRFNVNSLLRADLKTRYDSYRVGIESGFLDENEARGFEDLPPREGRKAEAMSARQLAEALQKIYLSVGKVITADEAREILNRDGAGLGVPGPIQDTGDAP